MERKPYEAPVVVAVDFDGDDVIAESCTLETTAKEPFE